MHRRRRRDYRAPTLQSSRGSPPSYLPSSSLVFMGDTGPHQMTGWHVNHPHTRHWHAAVPLKKAAAATSSPSHDPNPKRPGPKLPGRLCWYHVPLAAGPYHRVALYMSSRVRLEGLGRPFEARGGQIRRQTSHLYRDSQHSNSRRGSATTQARIVSRCITGRATTHRCSPPSLPNHPASPRLCQAGGRPGSRRQSSSQHPS